MKKFYAIAAAACAALSMNAQSLYICGNGEGLAWTPETPMEVALADGAYTAEINNLVEFKISTVAGDWTAFNGGALCANVTKDLLGTPVELTEGDANIATPWKGDYKVVVSGDLKTITLTTTTPEPTGPVTLYLRGGMNEWGAVEDYAFVLGEDGKYSWEGTIAAGVEFKVADADWGSYNYGAGGVIAVNTVDEYLDGDECGKQWNYNDQNGSLAEDFDGTIFVELVNPEAPKEGAWVSLIAGLNGVESVVADNCGETVYYNLQGVRVAEPANGLYIAVRGGKSTKTLVK